MRVGPFYLPPSSADGTPSHGVPILSQFTPNLPKPCENCFVTAVEPDLVDAAGTRLAQTGLPDALARAFAFAEQHGIDPQTGAVCAAVDAQGVCIDGTQRIWAQTEYLRALATHGGTSASAPLAQQIEHFAARFLHPRGWFECKTADGQVSRADMPSTTPYHLATAYAALPTGA